jgi:hypothetical protein
MGLLRITLFTCLIAAVTGLTMSPFCEADDDAPTIHVQQVDPNFDSQKMAGPGVKIHSADELDRGGWKLPARAVREKIFSEAGMTDEVAKLDALDRDILFANARDTSAKRLVESYSKLPKEHLLKLSRLAKSTLPAKKAKGGEE